jgi:hypothetical protein
MLHWLRKCFLAAFGLLNRRFFVCPYMCDAVCGSASRAADSITHVKSILLGEGGNTSDAYTGES